MGTGAYQLQLIASDTVDQKPIGLDVEFPIPLPISSQRVVAVTGR